MAESSSVRLARIEEKLDALLEQRTDHESRLRKVEARQHWWAGAAAIIGMAFGYGSSHFKL